jgi:hypothetical protein
VNSTEDWYEVGFAEGLAAASAEMVQRPPNFGRHEANLVMGHALHDGIYNLVSRSENDFQSIEAGGAWINGIGAGAASAGGRIGFQTAVGDPASESKFVYVFVVGPEDTAAPSSE